MATRKKTTARKAAKKSTPRKAAARKAPARKAAKKAAKKTAKKKTVKKAAKKAPARKTAAARKTTAAKKVTKRTAATKTAGRTTARKAATKKAHVKVAAKKAGTASGRTMAVKESTPRKSAGPRVPRPGMTPPPNVRKATTRPVGAAGVTEEEKSQRRRAARTDAKATIEPADGVTTNFGTATAATPRDTDRGTSRTRKAHRITPEEALANTRELLEAKQARDREPPPWRQLEAEHGQPVRDQATPARDAEQEAEANMRAEELHRAESRLDAIQGSVSQQDRHRQGRRDAKG